MPKCQNGRLRADLPSISRDHNSATTGPISKSFGVFNMYSSRGRLLGGRLLEGSTFGGRLLGGSTFGGISSFWRQCASLGLDISMTRGRIDLLFF